MYDDDRDALAAEYVLGTLSADERDQAEALLAIDPAFAEIVRVWERRLGELNVMVEAVEPPAEVWEKIKAEINGPPAATQAPRLTTEEEFSFPPIEDTAPQTAPDLAAAKPREAAAAETPAQEAHEEHEPHEQHEPSQPEPQEQPELEAERHEPDEHDQRSEPGHPIPMTDDESLDDLLAAPLPEAPQDLDEPSEALASSLLPPEPETATPETAAKPVPPESTKPVEASNFELDLSAAVLEDLARARRERSGIDQLGKVGLADDLERGDDLKRGPAPEPLTASRPRAAERNADVVALSRRARRWRQMTAVMTAIAAMLALYVGVSKFAPGLMPVSRPAPQPTVTAQVASPPPSRLVAVLQQDPTTPAFLVSVDPANHTLTVRRVSAAPEASRSYELWLISNKYPAPRSLGLVGASEFTSRTLPAGVDTDTIKSASYAISLEPAGGSTTGAPTGPILFKGHMVEALPGSSG
jgi:anti-sigma-K factor RskA